MLYNYSWWFSRPKSPKKKRKRAKKLSAKKCTLENNSPGLKSHKKKKGSTPATPHLKKNCFPRNCTTSLSYAPNSQNLFWTNFFPFLCPVWTQKNQIFILYFRNQVNENVQKICWSPCLALEMCYQKAPDSAIFGHLFWSFILCFNLLHLFLLFNYIAFSHTGIWTIPAYLMNMYCTEPLTILIFYKELETLVIDKKKHNCKGTQTCSQFQKCTSTVRGDTPPRKISWPGNVFCPLCSLTCPLGTYSSSGKRVDNFRPLIPVGTHPNGALRDFK